MFYEERRIKQGRLFLYTRIILSIKDSLQQQIHFNGNIFVNKYCRCNEGSPHLFPGKIVSKVVYKEVSNSARNGLLCHMRIENNQISLNIPTVLSRHFLFVYIVNIIRWLCSPKSESLNVLASLRICCFHNGWKCEFLSFGWMCGHHLVFRFMGSWHIFWGKQICQDCFTVNPRYNDSI